MKRRSILRYTALITGAAVSPPLASLFLSSCATDVTDNDKDYQRLFFNEEEFFRLRTFVDIILPETDSPSASGVGVHRMLDQFTAQVLDAEEQLAFKTSYNALFQHLNENDNFDRKKEVEKATLIEQLTAEKENEAIGDLQKTLLSLRQQTILFYLSTEEVATNYLNYLPVPGAYEACISLEEVGGKAWAL